MLGERLGKPVRLTRITREPSPFATVFPAYVLRVALADGPTLSLWLKALGAEQADHPEKQRRDREVRIYEELLGDHQLPVVSYFGSTFNRHTQRLELVLEYIDDWNLKYQPHEHWFDAARRLAHLHVHFAARADELERSDFLLRFDRSFFEDWAQRALATVRGAWPDLGRRLGGVVRGYGAAITLLEGQPPTLVHNDLSPKNVVVDRSRSPARICIVDWEMAGVGCGVLDLVHLKYGLDQTSDREMCAVYLAELAGTGLIPGTNGELSVLFAAAELHKTLYRLAFSAEWKLPRARVEEWVADSERFLARI